MDGELATGALAIGTPRTVIVEEYEQQEGQLHAIVEDLATKFKHACTEVTAMSTRLLPEYAVNPDSGFRHRVRTVRTTWCGWEWQPCTASHVRDCRRCFRESASAQGGAGAPGTHPQVAHTPASEVGLA